MTPRTINILVGDSEPVVSDCIRAMLEHIFGEHARINVINGSHLDELLKQASTQQFDLCFLSVNNVIARLEADETGLHRIEKVVASIKVLKASGVKAVVACSSYIDTPEFRAKVCQAGADYFLPLPFQRSEFDDALQKCLGPVSSAGAAQ